VVSHTICKPSYARFGDMTGRSTAPCEYSSKASRPGRRAAEPLRFAQVYHQPCAART